MRNAMKPGLVAAVIASACCGPAAPAGATLTPSSSSTSMTTAPFEVTSITSCDLSAITLENPVSLPAGQGGAFDATDVTWDGCVYLGSAATFAPDPGSLPWTLTFRDGMSDSVDVSGIAYTMSSAFLSCSYAGSVTGEWTNNDTMTFFGASGLTKTAGGFLCPNAPTWSAEFVLDNSDTIAVS
jgi:hypothetical protein